MWERVSYYGMVALLVLFLIEPESSGFPPGPGEGFTGADAAALFGVYSALVLAAPLLADGSVSASRAPGAPSWRAACSSPWGTSCCWRPASGSSGSGCW